MGLFDFLKFKNAGKKTIFRMINDVGNGYYTWNGKLYQSDIIRACIKPRTKAIGKLVAKHIRTTIAKDGTKHITISPEPYMRFLLEEPNEYMTGQMLQEKVANQLALNNNAFLLILRDVNGWPCGLYPIPCAMVEAVYKDNVYLKFSYINGKSDIFPYTDIIHLRDDFMNNDLFGDSPAEALTSLMNVIGTIDYGIVAAIKNSGIIKWLLKVTTSMRDEDLKKYAKNFADNYLSLESESLGVAAVDSKADAVQVTPTDYVPNAQQMTTQVDRIYAFFNTNKKIVTSTCSEAEWVAYYEQCIEPLARQMAEEYTRKMFTREKRSFGNKIIFEASNLSYASAATKLSFVAMVDRGAMTPNEWRELFNMGPVDGGDVPLLRKDTGLLTTEGGENNGD